MGIEGLVLRLANTSPLAGPQEIGDKESSIKEEEKKCHLDKLAGENDQGGKGKEETSRVGHIGRIKNKERKKGWLKLNVPNWIPARLILP